MLLTGCVFPAERSDDDMPQATAAPLSAADAATAAPDLLANAGLTLPADATDVEVDLITFDVFSEISVTRFTAPPAAARAVCTDAGGYPSEEEDVFHQGYEKGMLGDFILEPGMTGCRIAVDPRTTARVFISADDPARVTVLIYRMPSR